jgi:hypothetical protein
MWRRGITGSRRFVHGLAILLSNLLLWFYDLIWNYNVFIPEEDDYEDDHEGSRDPGITMRHQKYATHLYIPLLVGE